MAKDDSEKLKTLSVSMQADLVDQVEQVRRAENRSRSNAIATLVAEALAAREAKRAS